MVPIQSLLADIMADRRLIQMIRDRAISIRSYSEEEADEEIHSSIDFIMDFYQAVGGLVSEIDRKHSNFTRSSIEKIQYLMTADHTIKGKLAEILTFYARSTKDSKIRIEDILENHINADRQEFFDEKSLYHKNVRSRRIDRDALAISLSNDLSPAAKEFLIAQIASAYTKSRIKDYLDSLFTEGVDSIHSDKIRISDESEFIMLILALIRQGEDGLPYRIEIEKGQVLRDGYLIPDMIIYKR